MTAMQRCCRACCCHAQVRAQVQDQGPLRELHCRRILPVLLPAVELLVRVLDLRLAHWHSAFGKTKRDAVQQARFRPTRGFVLQGAVSERGD